MDAGTGEPLGGVTVKVRGTKRARITDDDGRFVFDEVSPGDVVLEAARQGYADATGSVSAARGQSLRLEIRMAMQPVVRHRDRHRFLSALNPKQSSDAKGEHKKVARRCLHYDPGGRFRRNACVSGPRS